MSRREVNVAITPTVGGHTIQNIPVCDPEDARHFTALGKSYPFTDIGCVAIAIKGHFRKNAGVKGRVTLLDDMWDNFDQAVIESFEFDLNNGYAAHAVFPGFSMTTGDMAKFRLRMIVEFTNLNVRNGGYEPISISMGLICRTSKNAFPNKREMLADQSVLSQQLINTQCIDFVTNEQIKKSLEEIFNDSDRPMLVTMEGSSWRDRRKFLRSTKSTKVLSYRAEPKGKSLEIPGAVRRMISDGGETSFVKDESDSESSVKSSSKGKSIKYDEPRRSMSSRTFKLPAF